MILKWFQHTSKIHVKSSIIAFQSCYKQTYQDFDHLLIDFALQHESQIHSKSSKKRFWRSLGGVGEQCLTRKNVFSLKRQSLSMVSGRTSPTRTVDRQLPFADHNIICVEHGIQTNIIQIVCERELSKQWARSWNTRLIGWFDSRCIVFYVWDLYVHLLWFPRHADPGTWTRALKHTFWNV